MQLCVDSLADATKKESYRKHLKDISVRFGDISDELYVFYHANTDGRCFMTARCVEPYKDRFVDGFDFTCFRGLLSDGKALTDDLIRFYLRGLSEEEYKECLSSVTTLFSYIKASEYTGEEKSKLYEFFVDPEPYIQALRDELTEKETRLSAYYKENYQIILDAHNDTTFDALCERVKEIRDLSFLRDSDQVLYTSFCLLNKYCMYMLFATYGVTYVLGYDYASVINAVIRRRRSNCSFDEKCSALGEKSRFRILQLLTEQNELTRKEIERAFDLSSTSAYHHLTMLTKVGAIKVRNIRKTIYYSLNKEFFDAMIEQLIEFAK